MERIVRFKFLGVHITDKLKWSTQTDSVVKKAQQHLSCHQKPSQTYRSTIESILTGCITAWYDNCSASDRKALQRVVRTAPVHHRG